jgi:hypothetical protein
MAKKTTSYNITEVNGKIRKVTTNTRIVQESRLQKSRRIASENSTLFRFALSGTIVMLFFGLFLLIGTTDFYYENQQELNWIDSNGQFIENSYNIQTIQVDNNVPLIDLNNLTLSQVFDVPNFFQELFILNNVTTAFYGTKYILYEPGDLLFISSEIENVGLIETLIIETPDPYLNYNVNNNFVTFNYQSNLSGTTFLIYYYLLTSVTGFIDLKIYNLTDLGINLDYHYINEYYQIYLNNLNTRSLESFYNLGNIPITNLENMNTVLFKPATDIVGGMTDTANTAIGFTLQAWNFVGDIWKRIWGVE